MLASTADGRRVVVRRYADDHVPLVDAAVLRRARSLVPVPEVLDVRAGRLVTSYVEGARGDLLVPTLSADELARLGADVGRIGAVLASVELPTSGLFVDEDLTIEPFAGTLPEWVTSHALELDGSARRGGGGGGPARRGGSRLLRAQRPEPRRTSSSTRPR